MFDEAYYDTIWGTIHRHDYCKDLANSLVAKYGKCRILDIGTGCGYLVECLNELGCKAVGIEISQYAVDNAHGNVMFGSVTNLPFATDSFDVVHSQGLWECLTEDEIKQAWVECKRVGKYQEHNFDTVDNDNLPEHNKVTIRSREWWQNMFYPRVLVACPTYDKKEYAMEEWLNNVKEFTYPNIEIFLVDNSDTLDLYKRWKDKVPMIHIDTGRHDSLAIGYSMEEIRKKFVAGEYMHWLNLEIDIIPPKDIIETLLKWGKDSDWICHAYPNREAQEQIMSGIGCSMFSRNLMENFSFEKVVTHNSCDGWMWDKIRNQDKFTTMDLYSYVHLKHLKDPNG